MQVTLHKNARTTPAIRQELRQSTKSERELAREYHLNRATVRKWRQRETGQDASHRPHRIHATLTPVFVKILVQCPTFPINDGQPVSWGGGRSGFSDTAPTGSQFRVSPVQRSG